MIENPIGNRLKLVLDFLNLSLRSFETKISAANGRIGQFIRSGGSIGSQTLLNIAVAFPNIDLNWLISGTGSMLKDGSKDSIVSYKYITLAPMTAQAGLATLKFGQFVESDFDKLAVDPIFLEPEGNYMAFTIEGDSMEGSLSSGDVLVTKQCELSTESFRRDLRNIYIVCMDDQHYCKRVVKNTSNAQQLVLHSDNPAYPPIFIELQEVQSMWRVVSRMTKTIKKLQYTLVASS